MQCPDTAAFRLSPPLVARPLARLAIRSGKSHPGLQMQPQPVRHRFESHRSRAIRPPDRYGYGRARAVRDSPSDVATCHRVVPTGIHSPELPDDRRDDRHKREPRLGPRRPTSPKDRAKSELKGPFTGPRSFWGRTVQTVASTVRSRIVTNRHATSRFYDFGQPFPSQGGPPEKKYHWGSGLSQRDEAKSAISGM